MRTLFATLTLGLIAVGCETPTSPLRPTDTLDTPDLARINAINERVVFASDRDGFSQIYIMNHDGSNQTQLTTYATGAVRPTLSPTGTHIAFVHDGDIWVMHPDGGGARAVTSTGTNDDPAWSPDGQQIVFSRRLGFGTSLDYELYRVSLDGLTEVLVTNDFGASAQDPVWSPDGSTIAFERNGDIYVVDATCVGCPGGGLLLADARDLAWSPDGTKIAYVYQLNISANDELWIADYDPTGPVWITNQTQVTYDAAVEANPTWSPDGSRIAFDTDRGSVGWTTRNVWSVRLTDMRPFDLTTQSDSVHPSWGLVSSRYLPRY